VSLIIWDEAPMTHCYKLEAFEHSLREISNRNLAFGRKMIIFYGDCRQLLPVVTRESRADVITSSISRTSFECYCNVQHLKINMRLMHSNLSHDEHERLRSFAEWRLNVGNGFIQGYSFLEGSEPDWTEIPKEFLINNDSNRLKNLIKFIYPCIVDRYKDVSYFQDRCILVSLNTDADELNNKILAILLDNHHTYLSSDAFLPSNTDSIATSSSFLEIAMGWNDKIIQNLLKL